MEEQREGRRERFCLDMEAQEADGQVDLGVKQMDICTCIENLKEQKIQHIEMKFEWGLNFQI